ncbi:MAG: TRAP transporter large permease [Desulfovibrio sp.]|jgi:C4-dicarboxylate transporter DctM subunit|nr:TRAP transporter large permease [Desulfovibrio sp.]
MLTFVLFSSFILLLALGTPIAISLGVAAIFAIELDATTPLTVAAQRMFSANDSFPLMAIPFFMLAGSIMTHGGISGRLVRIANAFMGHWTGGLGIVSVVTSMFFAAISGSSAATTAAIGGTLIPEMEKKGYKRDFSSAIVASAGTTGIVIPPSTAMIVYGVTASASIGKLFMGGLVPGMLMGLAMILVVYAVCRREGYGKVAKVPWGERISALKDGIWGILMPVIVLGGIYGGIFTPTESAAVACFYGMFVGVVVYRDVKLRSLYTIFSSAVIGTAVVMLIMSTAMVFGYIVTANKVPQMIAAWLLELSSNAFVIMLLINIFLLLVGCFLNVSAAIIILVPVLLPVVTAIGYDPVAFGVIMTVNMAIGCITPPVGVDLFVAQGISGVPIEKIARSTLPFLISLLVVLAIITAFPQIILFLPDLLAK